MRFPMKNLLFICLIFLMQTTAIDAQEIAPFTWKHHKGIALNKKNMPQLLDKTWTIYKQYKIDNQQAMIMPGTFMAFKVFSNGQFNGTIGNQSLNGNWTIKKRELNLVPNGANDETVSGTYAVYKLNETELVLVKERSGDSNSQMVYYCRGSKMNVLAERPTTTLINQTSQSEQKAFEESRKKSEQQALINEIKTEAQLRDIKMKEKLETMDVKSLQDLKNQVLAGEYQQKKTKN